MLGVLAENLIASYFFRLKETVNIPTGVFYDPEKGGVEKRIIRIPITNFAFA
jgi:hypothetical protein